MLASTGQCHDRQSFRQKRRRLRKNFVAMVTRMACVVALMAIFSVMLGSTVRSLRAYRYQNDNQEFEKLESRVIAARTPQVIRNIRLASEEGDHSQRFKRSSLHDPVYAAPGDVSLNGVEEESLLPWKELERFKGVIPLGETANDVEMTEETSHVQPMPNRTYDNEFDRVEAYCKETITNRYS